MNLKEYIPYYRRNLKVALPVMLTQLGATLVGLIDMMMVGHYATTDFAAVSFSNAIFFTVMVFAMGALMGITPLVGQQVGHKYTLPEDQQQEADEQIAHSLKAAWVFTLLLGVVTLLLLGACYPFLDSFGQDPDVAITARPYYGLCVLSIIPLLFFCTEKQFLEGLGNTTFAMLVSIGMNLLNIALNYVLIFGHCGFPAMGATGAGIATLVARTLMPVVFFAGILLRREWRRYLHTDTVQSMKPQLKRFWQVGLPIGLQTFAETIAFTLSSIIVGWLSKETLAAHQIAIQISDITFMLAVGIGSATTIRVSHQLGKGDLKAVHMAANASVHLVLMFNTLGALLMISLRHYIPYIFTNDTEVIRIAADLLLCAGLFQYADGLQCVGAAMLRGITDVKRPMIYAFISYIVIAIPVGLFCTYTLGFGAVGMWIGFIVGLSCAAAFFHIRFRRLMNRNINQSVAL